jgi:hypothetical protein
MSGALSALMNHPDSRLSTSGGVFAGATMPRRTVPSNDPNQCFQGASRAYDTVERYRLLSANGAVAALLPVGLEWLAVTIRPPFGERAKAAIAAIAPIWR